MTDTSISLLNNLRTSPQEECWEKLTQIYSPLIRMWTSKYRVQDSDAEDLVQEVLLAVSKDIRGFEHRGPRAFRGWLKAILLNRLRKYWRNRDRLPKVGAGSELDRKLDELEDPASGLSVLWNQEHDLFVLRQLLEFVKPHFEPKTWMAFCQVTLNGSKPESVAQDLGISPNAVCLAKSRVIRRLRQEADGLVESSSNFF